MKKKIYLLLFILLNICQLNAEDKIQAIVFVNGCGNTSGADNSIILSIGQPVIGPLSSTTEKPSLGILYCLSSGGGYQGKVFSLSDATGSPGDEIVIPIIVNPDYKFTNGYIEGELTIDPTLLYPIDPPADINQLDANRKLRTIKFPLPIDNGSIKLENKPKFIVTLGNKTEFEMKLTVKINDTIFDSSTSRFRLTGFCQDGGNRVIGKKSDIELFARPNPAEEYCDIEFRGTKNEKTKIFMVNSMGQVLKTIFEGESTGRQENIKIDLKNFTTGIYNVILQTIFGSKAIKLDVIK